MRNFVIACVMVVIVVGGVAVFSDWVPFGKNNESQGDQLFVNSDPNVNSTSPQTDDVFIRSANISGEDLVLVVSYPGCAQHTFSLYVEEEELITSDVTHVSGTLVHDAHEDSCEKASQSTIDFSMLSLKEIYGENFMLTVTDSEGNSEDVDVELFD